MKTLYMKFHRWLCDQWVIGALRFDPPTRWQRFTRFIAGYTAPCYRKLIRRV